ncbi:DUF3784 domain-containing protein [Flavobacteriaceae bacterium]|nr:DUF3784 domain-containing protein [Flavobacteriaceae bacterium]
MMYGSLITAMILILTGLIVKNNPDLMAGYNTLSKEEKENIDTDKLTQIARRYLVLTGLSVLIVGGILSLLNVPEKTHLYVVCGIVVFGIMILIIQSNRLKPKP